MPEIGDRVGAIRSMDEEHVELFGYGVYLGREVPPDNILRAFWGYKDRGELLAQVNEIYAELGIRPASNEELEAAISLRFANPKIQLDSGLIVWGCESWWGPEAEVRARIAGREVVLVKPTLA